MPITETHKLQLVRTFHATPQDVYAAWTTPAAVKQFFVPREGMTIPVADMDVRVGGSYRIVMKSPDGVSHIAVGVFKEVVPGQRLVYTWSRPEGEGCDGSGAPIQDTLITIEFRAKGSGTEMTFTHDLFPDTKSRDAHQNGWSSILDRLATFKG